MITSLAESLFINSKFRESQESFMQIKSDRTSKRTSHMFDKRLCRANILQQESMERLPGIGSTCVSPRLDILESSVESLPRLSEIEIISQKGSLENIDTKKFLKKKDL